MTDTPNGESVGTVDVVDLPVDVPIDDVVSPNGEPEQVTFTFPQLTTKKVAIVGFAGGHAHEAPFNDPDVEIWGINRLHSILPDRRWTRWFELHDLDKFYRDDQQHQEWLRSFDGPVYVRAQDYALARSWGIETAQPFPHRILLERFLPYFNNTISWLTGLAIVMSENGRTEEGPGLEWLGFYGVDMAQDNLIQAEYSEQRPSCEYFMGIAVGRGIELYLPPGSDMLKGTHLYGFEDSGPVLEKMMSRFQELGRYKEQVRAKMSQLQAEVNAMQSQINQLDGAMQETTFWRKNWLTLPGVPAHLGSEPHTPAE